MPLAVAVLVRKKSGEPSLLETVPSHGMTELSHYCLQIFLFFFLESRSYYYVDQMIHLRPLLPGSWDYWYTTTMLSKGISASTGGAVGARKSVWLN